MLHGINTIVYGVYSHKKVKKYYGMYMIKKKACRILQPKDEIVKSRQHNCPLAICYYLTYCLCSVYSIPLDEGDSTSV